MNIVICGAGETGSHAAETLARDRRNDITIIDINPDRVRAIEETMDVATFRGNVAQADVLRQAGADRADIVVAATDSDEVNLLCASIAKGIGAKKSVARVHHSAYFDKRGLDYGRHLGIDLLICPEYSTALAIASQLRNPVALKIEDFARGSVEMQQFPVSSKAPAIGRKLHELGLPSGTRLCAYTRKGASQLPDGSTEIREGDIVILVGNADVFHDARRVFHDEKTGRRDMVIMGGTPMAVWLCRALRDRSVRIRLFDTDRERAEELAEKLPWVTVLHGDPTEEAIFEEEQLGRADLFVALLDHDESNILGCALAKSKGVTETITVIHRINYIDKLRQIARHGDGTDDGERPESDRKSKLSAVPDPHAVNVGIDSFFSPRRVAVRKIEDVADASPLRVIATMADKQIKVYRVRVGERSTVVGKRLRAINLSPRFIICAVQHGDVVRVPSADETLEIGDTVMVVARPPKEDEETNEERLSQVFATS